MPLALNVFKTITSVAPINPIGIYTAPTGYTGVVLLAQVTNISPNTHSISFFHRRTRSGIAVTTELLKDYPIPGNDSSNLLTGKLVLESSDVLVLSASDGSNIKFVASILETLN
jgi:hypothetical protein